MPTSRTRRWTRPWPWRIRSMQYARSAPATAHPLAATLTQRDGAVGAQSKHHTSHVGKTERRRFEQDLDGVVSREPKIVLCSRELDAARRGHHRAGYVGELEQHFGDH